MLLKFSVKLPDKGKKISASRYGRVLGYFDLGIYSAPIFLKSEKMKYEYDLKDKQIKYFWTLARKIVQFSG